MLDLGNLIAYAFVLVAAFFLIGVGVLFTLLHWLVRLRRRREALAPPASMQYPNQVPAQRSQPPNWATSRRSPMTPRGT
ncbi:MAG TPA: hypothetical protein VFE65_13135 [Pseudonocardia sp.]|jgi:hypothetical protein|nr:hypothetical protein [Pseudonocardia sp.]